jgi:hypothetical protein
MNITDFVSKRKKDSKDNLTPASVKLNGTQVNFWVKKAMALDSISLYENSGSVFAMSVKQKEAKDNGEKYVGSGAELADMQRFRARQVLQLMCQENGAPVFAKLDDLLATFESEEINKIAEEIDKVAPSETVEEAEKNSSTHQDEDG